MIKDGKIQVIIAEAWTEKLDDCEWRKLVDTAETKLAAGKGKGGEKGKGKQPPQ